MTEWNLSLYICCKDYEVENEMNKQWNSTEQKEMNKIIGFVLACCDEASMALDA